MNKRLALRTRVILALSIAGLLIFGTQAFLLIKLKQVNEISAYSVNQFRQTSVEALDLESLLFQLILLKNENDPIEDNSEGTDLLININDKTTQVNRILRRLSDQKSLDNSSDLELVTALSKEILGKTYIGDKEEDVFLFNLKTAFHQLRVGNFQTHLEDLESNKGQVEALRTTTFILTAITLIILGFIGYFILQILNFLNQINKNSRKLNHELEAVQNDLTNTNWILNKTNLLNEDLIKVEEVDEVLNTFLAHLKETLGLYAASVYIRQPDSSEFELSSSFGVAKASMQFKSFTAGDGILGSILEDRTIRYINIQPDDQIQLKTSLTQINHAKVVICPLSYDDFTLGVVELFGEFENIKQEHLEEYLHRTCRSATLSIQSLQNHQLVKELLKETQAQSEEMEAHQEELRITNEELMQKTHLLEASEEELRVQQEELTESNISLNQNAQELKKKNIDLKKAQEAVEQKIHEVELSNKYKSEFMANMSHELRTPLNSVLILAKLLKDNNQNNLSEEQVKYATVIHSAGSDLLNLINDILDLSKIEAGKYEILEDKVLTKEIANRSESLFRELAESKNIHFKIEIAPNMPEDFMSDEDKINQILKNFLSNAFKFTNEGGDIHLRFYKKEDRLYFECKDSGKGIQKEKLDIIFEAFRQEDGSTSRKYGGTGLGLSISKEIATLLGGEIQVVSEEEEGSTFTFTCPYKPYTGDNQPVNQPERSQVAKKDNTLLKPSKKHADNGTTVFPKEKEAGNKAGTGKKTILIIEDDHNFAEILKDFALQQGFEAALAYNGENGIRLAQEILPHAILLDVMLPIANGWEVLKTLKNDIHTKHIPIHMMSAASFDPEGFIKKGAIGFMSKPASEEKIIQIFEFLNQLESQQKSILIIEDQEVQSNFIRDALEQQNIKVAQAFTGKEALENLESNGTFDTIILDLQLPDMDGLELLSKIKADPEHSSCPVIINTAYELPRDKVEYILKYSNALILKAEKSHDRLMDEINLFLNKINENYQEEKEVVSHHKNGVNKDVLEGKKILIADDDMRNVFALSNVLQNYAMEVEIAYNGKEAVEVLEKDDNKIDLVLIDIMMPEMDGYEAIGLIRKNKSHQKLPILAVTAKAMKGDKEKSIEAGANDYISKPIDIDKLISLLRVWLS